MSNKLTQIILAIIAINLTMITFATLNFIPTANAANNNAPTITTISPIATVVIQFKENGEFRKCREGAGYGVFNCADWQYFE